MRPLDFYLAVPYSHPNKLIMNIRFETVTFVLAELSRQGKVCFSPITHSHKVSVDFGVDGEWEFWQSIDFKFLDACQSIIVLKLDGWDRSRGVLAEIEYAKQSGMKLYQITDFDTLIVEDFE